MLNIGPFPPLLKGCRRDTLLLAWWTIPSGPRAVAVGAVGVAGAAGPKGV